MLRSPQDNGQQLSDMESCIVLQRLGSQLPSSEEQFQSIEPKKVIKFVDKNGFIYVEEKNDKTHRQDQRAHKVGVA